MPKKKPKHGGARPGAGRKRTLDTDAVRRTVHLPKALDDAIDRHATSRGVTRSEVIRETLAAAFGVKE